MNSNKNNCFLIKIESCKFEKFSVDKQNDGPGFAYYDSTLSPPVPLTMVYYGSVLSLKDF